MLRFCIAATLALCALVSTAADASARARRAQVPVCDNSDVMRPCAARPIGRIAQDEPQPRGHRALKAVRRGFVATAGHASPVPSLGLGAAGSQIVAHPAGCPARLFCGCGAAVRVFGQPVRSLWLAAAWFKFPRAAPAPGMAAVRRHHVFVLEQHLGGSTWLAYDANSGGHATRIHARSIASYVIVNPRGGA